jgi:hypothetical protein
LVQGTALWWTLVLEAPLLAGVGVVSGLRDRRGLARLLAVGAAGSLLTHPFAWAAIGPARAAWGRGGDLCVEGAVAVVEAALLARWVPLAPRWAVWAAVVANGGSYAIGRWLTAG